MQDPSPPGGTPPLSAAPPAAAPPASWAHNARLGLGLFAVYLALYAGFIYLSAFARDTMARPSVGGVNLAVVYGFALIGGAFVLALVYMVLCQTEPAPGPALTDAELSAKAAEEEGGA